MASSSQYDQTGQVTPRVWAATHISTGSGSWLSFSFLSFSFFRNHGTGTVAKPYWRERKITKSHINKEILQIHRPQSQPYNPALNISRVRKWSLLTLPWINLPSHRKASRNLSTLYPSYPSPVKKWTQSKAPEGEAMSRKRSKSKSCGPGLRDYPYLATNSNSWL